MTTAKTLAALNNLPGIWTVEHLDSGATFYQQHICFGRGARVVVGASGRIVGSSLDHAPRMFPTVIEAARAVASY